MRSPWHSRGCWERTDLVPRTVLSFLHPYLSPCLVANTAGLKVGPAPHILAGRQLAVAGLLLFGASGACPGIWRVFLGARPGLRPEGEGRAKGSSEDGGGTCEGFRVGRVWRSPEREGQDFPQAECWSREAPPGGCRGLPGRI